MPVSIFVTGDRLSIIFLELGTYMAYDRIMVGIYFRDGEWFSNVRDICIEDNINVRGCITIFREVPYCQGLSEYEGRHRIAGSRLVIHCNYFGVIAEL